MNETWWIPFGWGIFVGTLPDSPPDSGSEPPYSPTDLHPITGLQQMGYHQYHQQHTTGIQPQNTHQMDTTMHMADTSNLDCHTANVMNGNAHKNADILLTSTMSGTMPMSSAISGMMLPNNDVLIHQNVWQSSRIVEFVCLFGFHQWKLLHQNNWWIENLYSQSQSMLGLGVHHTINMDRNMYRDDVGNGMAQLGTDDFMDMMNEPLYQTHTNNVSNGNHHQHHQQQQQQQQASTAQSNSNSYNQHMLSQIASMPSTSTVAATSHSNGSDDVLPYHRA